MDKNLKGTNCVEFTDHISDDITEKKEAEGLNQDCFNSIITYGSTDQGNTEQEIILNDRLEGGKPVAQFVELASVHNANATNITEEMKSKMKKNEEK